MCGRILSSHVVTEQFGDHIRADCSVQTALMNSLVLESHIQDFFTSQVDVHTIFMLFIFLRSSSSADDKMEKLNPATRQSEFAAVC